MLARCFLISIVLALSSSSAFAQYGYDTTRTQPSLAVARINDQGQLVVKNIIPQPVYETQKKTVTVTKIVPEERTKVEKRVQDGKEVEVEVPYTVQVPVTVQEEVEVRVTKAVPVVKEFAYSQNPDTKEYHAQDGGPKAAFYETDGQEVPAASLARRLTGWQPIVVSSNGEVVPDYYTYIFKPGTLVAALPPQPMPMVVPFGPPAEGPPPVAPMPPTEAVPTPQAASVENIDSTIPVAFQQNEEQDTPKGLPPTFAFAKLTDKMNNVKLFSLRTITERSATQPADYAVAVPNANGEPQTEMRKIEMQHIVRTHDIWEFHGLGPVKAMTGDGRKLGWQDLPARLPREATVLIMTGGRSVDAFWLKSLRPETLILSTPIPDESLFQHGHGGGYYHHAPMPSHPPEPPTNGQPQGQPV